MEEQTSDKDLTTLLILSILLGGLGFDRFYGYNCQRHAHHYYPYYLWNDDRRDMLWGNFGMETEEYGPTLIHKELLTFIENNQNKPFYCFYALIQPHAEMFAPEEYMEKYRGKFLQESFTELTLTKRIGILL